MNRDFVTFAKSKGVDFVPSSDEQGYREAIWRLIAKGLAVPGDRHNSADFFPHISITEYGIKCLESGKIQAHDPNGYLESLRKRSPNLDPIVEMYISEALNSFGAMNYLACSVMIGGALEKTVLNLTETFEKKLSGKEKTEYNSDVLSVEKAKTRLDKFLEFLNKHGYKKKLDQSTREKLDSVLPAITNIIRIVRNEIGHPTGRVVDQEEAEASLLLAKEGIVFSGELLVKL